MKLSVFRRCIKVILSGLLLVSLSSCSAAKNKQYDLTPTLQASFEKIYYAKYALEFPHTESALNNCVEYNNNPCLDVFKQFKDGKKIIMSLASDKSLHATLDIIEKACLSEEPTMKDNICYGGLMSLYFYNSREKDRVIFNRIKKYPSKIKDIVFNNGFLWFHNRPKNKIWVDYISELDIEWKQSTQKDFVMKIFKTKIGQIDGDPWVFR